jgi:hypothetical protein
MARELIPPTDDSANNKLSAIRIALSTWDAAGGGCGLGSIAGEVFGLLFGSSYEKRRNEWMTSVGLALMDLLRRTGQIELEIERIQRDDQFLTTLATASRIAQTTHSETKREALKNAVINMASRVKVDEVYRQLFLRYIDDLTEAHINVLAFAGGKGRRVSPPFPIPPTHQGFLSRVFPELSDKKHLRLQIWRDLLSRGLVKDLSSSAAVYPPGIADTLWTEPFGDEFLRFILSPHIGNVDIPSEAKPATDGKQS